MNGRYVKSSPQPLPLGSAVGDACAARNLAVELLAHAPTPEDPYPPRLLLTATLLHLDNQPAPSPTASAVRRFLRKVGGRPDPLCELAESPVELARYAAAELSSLARPTLCLTVRTCVTAVSSYDAAKTY